jgi:hypothetical protein
MLSKAWKLGIEQFLGMCLGNYEDNAANHTDLYRNEGMSKLVIAEEGNGSNRPEKRLIFPSPGDIR